MYILRRNTVFHTTLLQRLVQCSPLQKKIRLPGNSLGDNGKIRRDVEEEKGNETADTDEMGTIEGVYNCVNSSIAFPLRSTKQACS